MLRRRQPPKPGAARYAPALPPGGGSDPAPAAGEAAQRDAARAGDGPGGRSSVQAVYASPGGGYLAIMSRWGMLSVHSILDGRLGPIQGTFHADPARRVSFAESAGLMSFISPGSAARVARLADMAIHLSGPGDTAALSPDGTWLATVCTSAGPEQTEMLQIRETAWGYSRLATLLPEHRGDLADQGQYLAFSPGGDWLAVSSGPGTI